MPRTFTPTELASLKTRGAAAHTPDPPEGVDLAALRRDATAKVFGLTPQGGK